MNYKGAYLGSTSYSIGDVVVHTDGVAYVRIAEPGSGITPHEPRAWNRLAQPLQEAVTLLHSMISSISTTNTTQTTNINNISKMLAPEYSKTTFAKGAIVTHSGKLYQAKAAINPADSSWTASHWDEITVGAKITALEA